MQPAEYPVRAAGYPQSPDTAGSRNRVQGHSASLRRAAPSLRPAEGVAAATARRRPRCAVPGPPVPLMEQME